MEQLDTATVKTVTPQELVKRMGISDKRVRAMLRSSIQRGTKNKSWQITPEQAKQVIKDYKAKVKERETKKQAEIDKQLKGVNDTSLNGCAVNRSKERRKWRRLCLWWTVAYGR